MDNEDDGAGYGWPNGNGAGWGFGSGEVGSDLDSELQ